MDTKNPLSLGWITAIAFILGTFIFGYQLEDYNPISYDAVNNKFIDGMVDKYDESTVYLGVL